MWMRLSRAVGAFVVVALVSAGLAACGTSRHAAQSSPTAPSQARYTGSSPAGSTRASSQPGTTTRTTRPATSTATLAGGAEGETSDPDEDGPCSLTNSADVGSAYGGKVTSETAGMSGIGNPICTFTLTSSNAGAPGRLSITIDASASAAAFASTRRHSAGAIAVSGVGDSAFYLSSTATLHFLKGHSAGVIQADFRMPHGMPPEPGRVRADTTALGKRVAAAL